MQNNVKVIEFHTNLRERALRWFIKWADLNQNPTVDDIKKRFVQEFNLPQTNQQGLLDLWEIK